MFAQPVSASLRSRTSRLNVRIMNSTTTAATAATTIQTTIALILGRVEAVVMAAGEGRRLRPLTERFAKPVLPIDGRPVVVTLLHELRAAGIDRVTVVTGHLAEQVERLLDGFDVRFVRQPDPLGSADAVRRGLDGLPALVLGADTVFAPGDIARFARAPGHAIAGRRDPPPSPPHRYALRIADGRVTRVLDDDPANT